MEVYLTMLLHQYIRAMGYKAIDFSSEEFIDGFNNWIKCKKELSSVYIDLLEYMKLYEFSDSNTLEIGKGKYDSVVTDFDTTIVTPYYEGIEGPAKDNIIPADFRVIKKEPLLIVKNKNKKIKKIEIAKDLKNFDVTFMTQNPYNSSSIFGWEHLHNSGDSNIIVGAYGSVYDKDKDEKIMQLKRLKDKLLLGYNDEYAVCNDNYYYVVASDRYGKAKIKERKSN